MESGRKPGKRGGRSVCTIYLIIKRHERTIRMPVVTLRTAKITHQAIRR
jgi:hypothetical protein